jgi:hypothetical protein
VRDSDGTVVFSVRPTLVGGSKQTVEFAEKHGRPCLHVSRDRDGERAASRVGEFLAKHSIRIMTVAGPRQSQEPGVTGFVWEVLEGAVGTAR